MPQAATHDERSSLMDGTQFDDLLRSFTQSRRTYVGGALAAVTGFLIGPGVYAKKRRKKKKIRRNTFGCVNVGEFCQHADQCCSSICDGGKCRVHDGGTGCQAGLIEDGCGGDIDVACTTSTGQPGVCNTTTGNAGYCIAFEGGSLVTCAKDADCRLVCGGDAAACIKCEGQGVCAGPSAGGCVPK
jgi:hypothetical protein